MGGWLKNENDSETGEKIGLTNNIDEFKAWLDARCQAFKSSKG
jgi:hypothetical protein